MSYQGPRHIKHQGKRVRFRALCAKFGLSYKTLWGRYQRGDRGERLVRPADAKYAHRGTWDHENHPAHP
jgi:hypothetical protein